MFFFSIILIFYSIWGEYFFPTFFFYFVFIFFTLWLLLLAVAVYVVFSYSLAVGDIVFFFDFLFSI